MAAPQSTTLHLVRHASYDMLGRGLAGRLPGHSLNAAGRVEAVQLGANLAKRPIAAVISSPLERARETAMPLAARLGVDVAIEPAFLEIDFGAWTGSLFDALHGDPLWRAWNGFRSTAAIPGGETMHAAQARALGALRRLPAGEVVVVSHADIIKAVLAHFLGTPLDLFHRIEIGPASRSVVTLYRDDVRIEAINLPPHA